MVTVRSKPPVLLFSEGLALRVPVLPDMQDEQPAPSRPAAISVCLHHARAATHRAASCVLRGGRLNVWPGLGTTRSLPPPGLRLKDQGFVLCVSTCTCTCTCMRIIRCLLGVSRGLRGNSFLVRRRA
eukprot:scaffold136977_cov99-Phaeocystis_antarctica.AAC.1